MTLKQQAQARHNRFGPVGEISQCAVLDLALPAEGLAQENTGGRVTVGDRFDVHGYEKSIKLVPKQEINTNLHGYIFTPKNA